MAEWLGMGGYAAYVWSAFGFTVAVMAGLLWQSWRAADSKRRELEAFRERRVAAEPARPMRAVRESELQRRPRESTP